MPEFWNHADAARKVLQEKAALERIVKGWQALASTLDDAEVLVELGAEEGDEELLQEAAASLESLEGELRSMELKGMLGEEGDENSAVLDINSGAGGTDASDWAEMLKRMYLRWAEKQGYSTSVVDEQHHDEAGIKHCTIEINGPYAYGYLKAESGVHRLVRISPFDANARRHTAFASVAAFPQVDEDFDIDIADSDLRIDTFRASGAGGQHVNTTDSAVRITHLPTGIVVNCQNERSQHKNRATAMKILRARIYQAEIERRQAEADAAHADRKKIEWGSQIRSYVLHPYQMVKDLRTQMETGNVDRFLDGDIQPFIESWLVQRTAAGLED